MYKALGKVEKISKGYRLKKETHDLVYKIQEILKSDQDTAISKACRRYYTELLKRKNKKIFTIRSINDEN